jgi:hypothetical protein
MIEPIYVHIVENTVSFANKKCYLINQDLPKIKHYYRLYYSLVAPSYTVYIAISLIDNSNIKRRTNGFNVPDNYLDNLRLVSFNELLELIESVNTSNDKSWDLLEVVNLLHLVVAKWDDWN